MIDRGPSLFSASPQIGSNVARFHVSPIVFETTDVALNVHLGFFAFRRGGQRDHPENSRTDALGDAI
jgi:hypothetical protein